MPKRCLVCSIFGIWFLFFFFFFFHSQSLPGSQPSPVTWIKDSVQFWSSQSQTHMYGLQKLQILTLKKTAFQPLSVWKIGLQKSVSQTCYYVAIQAEQTVSQVCFQGYSRQVPHNCHSLCLYKNVSCGAASFSVTERPFRCKSIWRNGLWWQNTKRASRASEFCHTHPSACLSSKFSCRTENIIYSFSSRAQPSDHTAAWNVLTSGPHCGCFDIPSRAAG